MYKYKKDATWPYLYHFEIMENRGQADYRIRHFGQTIASPDEPKPINMSNLDTAQTDESNEVLHDHVLIIMKECDMEGGRSPNDVTLVKI